MTTVYPGNIDDFTNPTGTDRVSTEIGGRTHSEMHSDENDAIEALQAKVGVNGSAVTTSHDYKLSGVSGSDKAASLTGTETLTNKTLTSPTINGATLTTPTIASFTNAQHNHTNAAGGGQITDAALSTQVTVAKGGTGRTTLTAYGPIFGGTTTTGAMQVTGPGNAGQVLMSNGASAIPTFQSIAAALTTTTTLPKAVPGAVANGATNINVNTTANIGRVIVDTSITAAKISFNVIAVSVAGNVQIALYNEDGQSQAITTQTVNVTATGIKSFTFTGSVISPGHYYIAIVPVGTASINISTWTLTNSNTVDVLNQVASEPKYDGTLTVTAGTLPSTFTPSALTYTGLSTMVFRLDN